MMPNSTKIAIAVVLLLASLALWSRTSPTSNDLQGRERRMFRHFVRNQVDEILIHRGAESYRLARDQSPDRAAFESGDFFLVRGTERLRADPDKVSMLFSAFEYAEPVRELGRDAPSHAGLEPGRARVSGDFQIGNIRISFFLGAPEVRGEGAYLRVLDTVVVAATDFVEALDHASDYYELAPSDAGVDDGGHD